MDTHDTTNERNNAATATTIALPSNRPLFIKIALGAIGALAIAIALFFGLSAASADSLPGQPLYTFKTNVAEEVKALTKLTHEKQTAYAMERLKTRITELKVLAADNATSSPEHFSAVAQLSDRHSNTVYGSLQDESSLPPEGKINTLAELQSLLRAEEVLTTDSPELVVINDQIGEIEKWISDELRTNIHTFASSSDPIAVQALIAAELTEVSEDIVNVAPGSQAQGLVSRRIEDTNEALMEGAYGDALRYIFKAQEAMTVDELLYDTERGFVEGQSKTAEPMPEGS